MSKLIVFEGLDRSGKTTLCKAVAEAAQQRVLCLDRWTTSCRVYDEYFERAGCDVEFLCRLEDTLAEQFDLLVVFVDTEPRTCATRSGTQYDSNELDKQRNLYIRYLLSFSMRHPGHFLWLHTKDKSVDQLVKECMFHVDKP